MADRIIKSDSGNDVILQNNSASGKIEVNNDGTIVFTGTSTDLIPSGTKMLFQQTSAPTGWTKATSSNDVALRVVSGTVGSGGSVAFETAFASHTPTASGGAVANHTLTTSELPDHFHTIGVNTASGTHEIFKGGTNSGAFTINSGGLTNTTKGQPHTHSFTQPTISAINLDVSYVDVIIATKD
tara:strand:- start:1690 stop:2241 length:552 start_codon:yes stop_codon:yes gene_type:complete